MTTGEDRERELREQSREKTRRLKRLREQLEDKDREIEALRAMLAQARSDPAGRTGQSAPVFFLVGQAKSGTTWLMRILNAHPEVLCRGEGRIFGRDYKREDIRRMESKTLQPSSLYRAILDAEYLDAWIERAVWTRDDDKEEHKKNLTRVATEYFLTERLSKSGKAIVGDKTPFLSEEIMVEIGEIYPGARVIHIIRDGRDAAVSTMHHLWNRSIGLGGYRDLEPEEIVTRDAYREDPGKVLQSSEGLFTERRMRELAEIWKVQVGRAIEDGPRFFGENYAEIRYEDLLERPAEEAGRLFGLLGARTDEETVWRCVESASFENWSRGRERGQEDSTALVRKGVAGDWRNVFTERDREIFKEVAEDLLIELGYERDHSW